MMLHKISASPVSNSKGFSLVEVMLAVGLLGIVSLGTSAAFQYTTNSEINVRAISDFNSMFSETQIAIADFKSCTGNLKTKKLPNLGEQPKEITISNLDANGVPTTDLVKAGTIYSNMLTVTSVTIESKSRLTPTKSLAEIKISGLKNGEAMGSKEMSQTIPIMTYVDGDNNITSCYGNNATGDVIGTQEQFCEIQQGSDFFFNPDTQKCESRLTKKQQCENVANQGFFWNPRTKLCTYRWEWKWETQNDPFAATCTNPFSFCAVDCKSTIAQNDPRNIVRCFQDGTCQVVQAPPAAICSWVGWPGCQQMTRTCSYGFDINNQPIQPGPGESCSVNCMIDLSAEFAGQD